MLTKSLDYLLIFYFEVSLVPEYMEPLSKSLKISSKEPESPKEGFADWVGEWFSIIIGMGRSRIMGEEGSKGKSINCREMSSFFEGTPQMKLQENPVVDSYRNIFIDAIAIKRASQWEEFSSKFMELIKLFYENKVICQSRGARDFEEDMEYFKDNPFDFYLALTTPGTEFYKVYQYKMDDQETDSQRDSFDESIVSIRKEVKDKFEHFVQLSIEKGDLTYIKYRTQLDGYEKQKEKCEKIENKNEREMALRSLYKRYEIDPETLVLNREGQLYEALAVVRAKENEVFQSIFFEFYEGDTVLKSAWDTIQAKKRIIAKDLGIDIQKLEKEVGLQAPSQEAKNQSFKLLQRFWENYDKDNVLRNAVDTFETKELALRNLLGFNCDALLDTRGKGIHRSGLERARDFVFENPRKSLAAASIIGGVFIAPIVPLAFGAVALTGVVGYKLYGRIEPNITQALMTEEDGKAYYKDEKVRRAMFGKILLDAPTPELKIKALKKILDENMLFQEDFSSSGLNKDELKDFREFVEPQLKKQSIKIEDLPSFAEHREYRKEKLKILREPFVAEATKREVIEQLFEGGLLYKEDLEYFSPSERTVLLAGLNIVYQELPKISSLQRTRNRLLQVLNGGIELSFEQRFEELKKMHAIRLFFKEDLEYLKNYSSKLEQEFSKYLGEENIVNLESRKEHYRKTKVVLQREHDKIREPFLAVLKDAKSSQEEKLFALKQMHMDRVCFLEDLDLPLIDSRVKEEFLKFIKRTPAERAAAFRKRPDAAKIIANHERILKSKTSGFQEKLDSFVVLYVDGLKTPNELKRLVSDYKVVIAFNEKYLVKLSTIVDTLPTRKDYYERGYAQILTGLAEGVGRAIKQHPGKTAGGATMLFGAGTVTVLGATVIGSVGGVMARGEEPVEVIAGPMREAKALARGGIEFAGEAIEDLTTIETKDLQTRLIKWLPSENQVKKVSTEVLNKSVGTLRYGIMGGAIGGTVAAAVSSSLAPTGMQIGAAIGGAYGLSVTDRTVNQLPPGGLARAMKFSAFGAMVGAATPVVIGFFTMGLAIGGLLAVGTALSIFSFGLGLIIPLIILGAYAGFKIAESTGTDVEGIVEDIPMSMLEKYEPAEI